MTLYLMENIFTESRLFIRSKFISQLLFCIYQTLNKYFHFIYFIHSGASEHCLKCHGQFNWLHPKTLSTEARYKIRKVRESLETKRSKCDSSKSSINRDDGNLVKTNRQTPFLRNINNLESAQRNQRSHCKANMMSN